MSNFFRVDRGINLKPQSGAPAFPVNGDMYYDDTLGQVRAYLGGSWVDISGGGGGIDSAFSRTGAVTAQSGDYNTSQVTESGSLYFTDAREIAAVLTGFTSGAGTVSASDSILQAIQKLDGNISVKQAAIQFKNEGSNIGSLGTINSIDFTGTGVTSSRTGDTLTVNISGGGYDSYYDNGTSSDINFNNGNTQKFTLSAHSILDLSNPNKAGDYYILVTSTGSFSLSPTNNIAVENGPIPSFTTGQSRLLRVVYTSASLYILSYSGTFTAL
jgi:hypothetical protein